MTHKNIVPHFIRDYAKCLRDVYLTNCPFPQPDWPINRASEAAKLFIVSKSRHNNFSATQIESQSQDYVYSKIDNITAFKKEVELADILNYIPPTDKKKDSVLKPPKVLMDGAPGIGKTTLCIKACSEWAEGRLFSQYELLISVPLRQPRLRKAKRFEDLIINCRDTRVIEHIFKTGGKHIAFIFDGYDELTHEQRQVESVYLDIILGNLLPNCAVLVTSRPYASEYLQKLHTSTINCHVELVGFKKEQIHECIKNNITDHSKAMKLIKQLDEREDIESLCYTPLNCVIVAYVYNARETLFSTFTSLFHEFVLEAVKRELIKNNSPSETTSISDLSSIPKPHAQHLAALEKVAYKSLSMEAFQIVFDYEDLESDSNVIAHSFGLITSVKTFVKDEGGSQVQFLHLSIQEYLAARFASKIFHSEEQIDLIREYVHKSQFRLFLLFYVGNTKPSGRNARILFRLVHKSSSNYEWTRNFFYFAHMIFETQCFDLFVHLFECVCDQKQLSFKGHKMTQFDCMLLAHFFCSVSHEWEKLSFEKCCLTLQSLGVFHKVYESRKSETKGKVAFRVIDLSSNSSELLNELGLFPWFGCTKKFIFNCETSSSTLNNPDLRCLAHVPEVYINHGSKYQIKELCIHITPNTIKITESVTLGEGIVDHLKGVKEVQLTRVNDTTVQVLEPAIQKTEVLVFSGIIDIDIWIDQFAVMLSVSKSLRILKFCHDCLNSYSAELLFGSLTNSSVEELTISDENKLATLSCDKVGKSLQKMLCNNKHLKKMQMCNAINDHLAQFLIVGLLKNTSLEVLDIDDNILTTDTILCIINSTLYRNDRLKELFVASHVLQTDKGKRWKLKYIDSHSNRTVSRNRRSQHHLCFLCALPNIDNVSLLNLDSVTSITVGEDLNRLDFLRVLHCLECNKIVKELKLDLPHSSVCNDSYIGHALQQMLTVNDVLNTLSCSLSCSISKGLADALVMNKQLNSLTLSMHYCCSNPGISCVMKALQQNQSVQKLSCIGYFTVCDSLQSDFRQLLECSTNLKELCTEINETIAIGVAEGLCTNTSLQKLEISFDSFKSFAVAQIMLSSIKSKLRTVIIHKFCSLMRDESSEWNVVIHDVPLVAVQLQYVFQNQVEGSKLKIKSLALYKDRMSMRYKVDMMFTDKLVKGYTQITILDLTRTHMISEFPVQDAKIGKALGIALKKLLVESSSLETLIFQSCELVEDTWEYIGRGLKVNNSVKVLNLCESNIMIKGVVSILDSLRHNCSLKELNLSDIKELQDDKYNSDLSSAIEKALRSNTSLQCINFQNTLSDAVTKRLAVALKKNKYVEVLRINENLLTCHTLHALFKLFDQGRPFQIHFDEMLLSITTENVCVCLTEKIVTNKFTHNFKPNSEYAWLMLFCGLCGIIYDRYRSDCLLGSLTTLEIHCAESDVVNLMFKMITKTSSLTNLCKLSLRGETPMFSYKKYIIRGDQVGSQLRTMLKSSNTIYDLSLHDIDSSLISFVADGLPHNSKIKKLHLALHDSESLDCHVVATLLHSVSSSVSLMELTVAEIPTMTRVMHSFWCFKYFKNINHNSRFPQFICMLNDISNGCVTPNSCAAESLVTSLSKINLSQMYNLDTKITVQFLQSLAHNTACKDLDLSRNNRLVNERHDSLSNAYKDFLTQNTHLEVLNVSGAINNTTAEGLIAGLQHNETVKHLSIDAQILKINTLVRILQIVDVKGFSSFTISDICMLNRSTESGLWQIKVLDEVIWSQFVSILKETSPMLAIVNSLDVLTTQNCLYSHFDSTCEKLYMRRCDIGHDVSLCPHLTISQIISSAKHEFDLLLTGLSGAAGVLQLRQLDVSNNYIGVSNLTKIINTLSNQNSLEFLDISHNCQSLTADETLEICSPAFGHSIEMLLQNKSVPLKVLCMCNCDISNLVCESIGSGIRSNHTLLSLALSQNKITTRGIKTILRSLQNNDCLQELDLSKNQIGRQVNEVLFQTLKNNSTLTSLNLTCSLNHATLKTIAAGLARNGTLKTMNVEVDVHTCEQLTLLSLMKSRVILSDYYSSCSLIPVDSGWKIEIMNTFDLRTISEILNFVSVSALNITEVVLSKSCYPTLKFQKFRCFKFNHIKTILQSLQYNNNVVYFSMNFGDYVKTHDTDLESDVESMLALNSKIKYLTLHGVGEQIAKGIQRGLRTNCSINKLCIDANNLSDNSISNLLFSMNSSQLRLVKLYPIIEFERLGITGWKFKIYKKHFHTFLIVFCNKDEVKGPDIIRDISNCVVHFGVIKKLPDVLKIYCYNSNFNTCIVDLSTNSAGRLSDVSQALETMVKENKALQRFTFKNYVDDSVAQALSRGLISNHTLQVLEIDVTCLSDDALNQLLKSLSRTPLTVVCRQTRTQSITFVRCYSASMGVEIHRNKVDSFTAKRFQSSALGRIFNSLITKCEPLKLAISSSRPYLQHRMVRTGVQRMLETCKTLKTLIFHNPVSLSIIKGLAAGLIGNKTLTELVVNKKMLMISSVKPIFISLQWCSITRLEFICEFVFNRELERSTWIIDMRESSVISDTELYGKLCVLFRTITINVSVDKILPPVDITEIMFKIPTVNIEVTKLLLESIKRNDLPVEKVVLHSVSDGSDMNFGPYIQEILKCNSLKEIHVNVSSSKLSDNLLVQRIFKSDFSASSVCSLKIGNFVLSRSEHRDPYKIFVHDEFGNLVVSKPTLSPWKVSSANIVDSLFVMLSQISLCGCSPSSLCSVILERFKELKPSDLSDYELLTLIKVLQSNTNVRSFNLSSINFRLLEVSNVDLCCALHELLSKTSTLTTINLCGIMNTNIAVSIALKLYHYKTLKSFSMDNPTIYGFDVLENILNSFADSNLNQLDITRLCLLRKDCDFWFVDLSDNKILCSNQDEKLLWSWSVLFMLVTICRKVNELYLLLHVDVRDSVPLKIFRNYFSSLRPAMIITESVRELCLNFTFPNNELLVSILKFLQNSSYLTKITISLGGKSLSFNSELQCVEPSFDRVLSCNTSLKIVNFTSDLSNATVRTIATGLRKNETLHTLCLKGSSLEVQTLSYLFESFEESCLSCLNIVDGCVINRISNDYQIKFIGNSLLLCKFFYASVQAQNCSIKLRKGLTPDEALSLVIPKIPDQMFGPREHFVSILLTVVEEGNVTDLTLSHCEMPKEADLGFLVSELLQSSKSRLRYLTLHCCDISDSDCELIARGLDTNRVLQSLCLTDSKRITSCGLFYLLESLDETSTIKELIISGKNLSTHAEEQELQNSDNKLQNESLLFLQVATPDSSATPTDRFYHDTYNSPCLTYEHTILSALTLHIKKEEHLIQIFSLLEHNKTVKKLDLSDSLVSTTAIGTACGQMLKSNKTLKDLRLQRCDVSNEVSKLIAGGLSQNKCLKLLDISRNYIIGDGLMALFKTLENSKSCLCDLNVSSYYPDTPVDDIKFDELETILACNTSLKVLEVAHLFQLNKGFGRHLFRGLSQNFTLTRLDMRKNILDTQTTCEFLRMVTHNTSITELVIRWCNFTPKMPSMEDLADILKHKVSLKVICDPITLCALKLHDGSIENIESTEDDCSRDLHHYSKLYYN